MQHSAVTLPLRQGHGPSGATRTTTFCETIASIISAQDPASATQCAIPAFAGRAGLPSPTHCAVRASRVGFVQAGWVPVLAGLSGKKYRIRLQVLDGDWDLHSNACARLRTAYVSRKGSRGGAEPRSNQNYHQEHEGHEEGVARECAQNTFACFVLFVVNNPLRVRSLSSGRASRGPGAPPRAHFLRKQAAVLAMPVFPGQPCFRRDKLRGNDASGCAKLPLRASNSTAASRRAGALRSVAHLG